jgi:hypothetical protein
MKKYLLWLCFTIYLLSSSAAAQRFSASLQFSSGGAFSSVAALTQYEISYNPIPELTIGAKIGLQNAPVGSVVVFQLNPYAYYRLLIASSETWFITGFAGVNINFNYAPPSTAATTAAVQSVKPTLTLQKEGADDDPKPVTKPIPNVSALGFRITTLLGIDGSWFIDEQNSFYFGLEADAILPPNFAINIYPYLEFDYQAFDALTIAIGGYLNIGNPFAYNVYAYGFYNLTSSSALRLELSWNGQFAVSLRYTLKG